MAHLHMHRPGYNSESYYESEKEVVRGPCNSYESEYRVAEYGNGGYPVGHHHHHNNGGYVDKVSEVVYESNPGYGHHHRPAEYIERREEIIREDAYGSDPCRRNYY